MKKIELIERINKCLEQGKTLDVLFVECTKNYVNGGLGFYEYQAILEVLKLYRVKDESYKNFYPNMNYEMKGVQLWH